MPVEIVITEVPEEIRDRLAARAKAQNKSMEEFLRQEMELIAHKTPMDEWLREVEAQKAASPVSVTAEEILNARDMDRK